MLRECQEKSRPSAVRLVLVLGSFFISVASAQGAAQQYQYANACYDCHGTATTDPGNPPNDFRPLDTAFRNITTGSFKGNHRTHMAQTTDKNACGKCHGDMTSYTTGHMNDKIDMSANINTSPGTATYSRGVQFNWTSNQNQVGYCSSVNCHFQATTLVWGTANFTYTDSTTNDCSQCHGAPPSGGGTGAVGSHTKHDAYFKGAAQCKKCHADHVAETGIRFAHATSAGNAGRVISVQLHDPADVSGGSYSGAGTNFLPSQSPTFGNCSNIYCHSDGKGNYATPTWGTASSGACGTCHGARNDAPPSPATPHQTHVGTAKGYLFACAKCHSRTVKSTADSTTYANISSYNFHVNKAKDVYFSALNPSGAWDGTNCATTYCHSNASPYLGTNTPVNQAWSGTLDCAGCHNKAGDTIAGAKAWSAPHTKHINTYSTNANMTCNACHALTASDNSTISGKANHVDGTKTIAWNAFANNAAPAYNLGTHQCQNVYCHGNGTTATPTVTVTWSGVFDCNGCHGGNAANPPASAPHAKHVGSGSPYRYSCAKCHSTTAKDTADSTGFANLSSYAFHVNKVKDVTFNAYNPGAGWSSPNCSSTYCHSIGNMNVATGTLPGVYGGSLSATPTWSGAVACNGCHGRSTANGSPDYPNAGAPGSPTSNSHSKHVISSAISCGECHEKTTKDGTTIRATSPSYHVNKTTSDVFFNLSGNSKNGTYDNGAKKCSTTYCHGTGPSIAWGDVTTCTSCHSANNSGPWNTSSAHKLHWEDTTLLPSKFTNTTTGNVGTAGTYRFACASCHNPGTGLTVHASGPADANGVAQVFFGYTAPGKNPTYTYGGTPSTSDNGFKWSNGSAVCTNTYCHSSGNGGSGATAVNWATTSNTVDPNVRCATCHLYTTIATGKHGKHVGTYGYSCAKCHQATTTDGSSIADKRKHVNKTKDVVWDSATDGGTPYSSPNCTNIYCHSQGQSATVFTGGNAPNTAAAWTGSMPADCTGCHGGNNATVTKMSTNKHLAHINYTSNVGRFIGCAECHAATASSDTSIGTVANHVNKKVDIKFDNNYNKNSDAPTYNGQSTTAGYAKDVQTAVGSCNNVYCHSDGNINGATPTFKTIAWNGAAIGCDGCHGSGGKAHPVYVSGAPASPTANSHVKHVEGSSLGCDFCHINTTADSAVPPVRVKNGGTHLNRVENVDFKLNGGKTGSYDSAAKTCSTTYCHGTGPSVAWGGATTCASCHDATKNLALRHDVHYNSTTTFWNLTGNNSHTGSSYAFGCKNCHPTNQHAQGPATVNRDAGIATTGVSKITAYSENGATATDARGYRYTPSGTCTTVCHSRDGAGAAPITAVNWGSAATGGCGICHNKAGDGSPQWSAPHTKHINTYSTNAAFTCNACHAGTAAGNAALQATMAARNQHTNGVKDIQFNSWVNASATYPNTATGCSNTYCHSQGTSYTSPTHSAILWSGSMTCASCHTGGTASGPTYGNGSPKANSHNKHVAVWLYTCEKCHYSTTTDGTTITNPANHVNQTYSLQASGGSVTFTVAVQGNPTTPSQCSNISCHGGNNATWGATLNCQDCHTGASDVDNFSIPFTQASAVAIIKTAEWSASGHGASAAYASGNPAANFAVETKLCEFCHDSSVAHNAGTNNIFRLKNYSTPEWGRNGPCMVCHGTGSAGVTVGVTSKNGTKKVSSFHYGAKHGPSNNGGQFCWDCHDGHGDGNAYMIHDKVAKVSDRTTGNLTTTVATTFTLSAPPNAVWGDYVNVGNTGLCQVCHAASGSLAHFRSDLYDANHNSGTRCTYCHSHSGTDRTLAFKPAGNCDLCHGYPPVRHGLTNGTVFRQGNYSGARFEDYTGGGGAHTIEKHIPAAAKASEGWANCTVCHNQEEAGHTMQTPVTPSKVTIDVKDRRKFDYLRQLGPERYSGKLTDKSGGSNTNITGSCSNTSCHFKPSKKWSNER